eukprot:364902-Chlamydomonas_euryale.AAC.11
MSLPSAAPRRHACQSRCYWVPHAGIARPTPWAQLTTRQPRHARQESLPAPASRQVRRRRRPQDGFRSPLARQEACPMKTTELLVAVWVLPQGRRILAGSQDTMPRISP